MDSQTITLSQLKIFQFIPTSREENFKGLENLHQYKRNCFKDIHLITSLIIVLGEVERRGFPFKDIRSTTIYTDGKICYIKEKDFTTQQQSNIVGNDSFKNFNAFGIYIDKKKVQQQFSYNKFQGVSSFDKALPKIYNVDDLTTDQEIEILETVYEIDQNQINQFKLGYFNKNKLNSQFKLETKLMNEQKNSESTYKDINKLEKLNDIQSVCQMISYIRIGTTMNMFTEYFQQNLEQFLKKLEELKTNFIEKLFEGLKDIHLKSISHENLCPQQIYLIDNQDSYQFKFQILSNIQDNSPIMSPNSKGSNQDDMWQMGLILLRYLSQTSNNKFENHDHKKYNNDLINKLDEIKNSENNNSFIPLTFSLLQYNKDLRCNHDKLCQELRNIEKIQQQIQRPDPPTLNIQSQLNDQIDYQPKVTDDIQQAQQPQLPEKEVGIQSFQKIQQGQSSIKIKNPNIQNIQANQNQIGTSTIIKASNQINQLNPQIQFNNPQQSQFILQQPNNINDQKSKIQISQGQQQIILNNNQINQQQQILQLQCQQIPKQQQNNIPIQQKISQNLFSTVNGQQIRQLDLTNPTNQSNINNQRQGSNP